MNRVSLHVIDGVDKGRGFLEMIPPITIGREEGNSIRLNDDRVSRFHAKIQEDHGCIVLTDLDSTNGTRVNGEAVQLRLLRPGDRIDIGRSTLVFGTPSEIASSLSNDVEGTRAGPPDATATQPADAMESIQSENVDIVPPGTNSDIVRPLPELPSRLSPAQAAQLSEVMDYLHRSLADAIEPMHLPFKSKEVRLPLANWQRVQQVMGFLADYSRRIGDPRGLSTRPDDE